MKKILLLLVLLWCITEVSYTQQNLLTRTVVLKKDTLTIKVDVFVSAIQVDVYKNLLYYSYYNNELHQTQGAYSGHLAHGRYAIYGQQHDIQSLGYFDKGLKPGLWKTWYVGGQLKTLENWSYGQKRGIYEKYHPNGELDQKGIFKNNEMDGKWYSYDSDTIVNIQKWSKGIKVEKDKGQAVKKSIVQIFKGGKEEKMEDPRSQDIVKNTKDNKSRKKKKNKTSF